MRRLSRPRRSLGLTIGSTLPCLCAQAVSPGPPLVSGPVHRLHSPCPAFVRRLSRPAPRRSLGLTIGSTVPYLYANVTFSVTLMQVTVMVTVMVTAAKVTVMVTAVLSLVVG